LSLVAAVAVVDLATVLVLVAVAQAATARPFPVNCLVVERQPNPAQQ